MLVANKKILFSILVVLFLVAYGLYQASKQHYNLYHCENQSDALNCKGTCKRNFSFELKFHFAQDKNKISINEYADGKLADVAHLEMCDIIDRKNWHCSSYYNDAIVLTDIKHSMNDGIYSKNIKSEYKSDKSFSIEYMCALPKHWYEY